MWYITSVLWICSLAALTFLFLLISFQRQTEGPHPCWLLTLTDLCSQAANTWCQIVGVCASNATLSLLKLLAPRLSIFYTLLPPHTLVFPKWKNVLQFAKSGNNILSWDCFILLNTVSMPLTFLLVEIISRKALAKSIVIPEVGGYYGFHVCVLLLSDF